MICHEALASPCCPDKTNGCFPKQPSQAQASFPGAQHSLKCPEAPGQAPVCPRNRTEDKK